MKKLWFKKNSKVHGNGLFAKIDIKKGIKIIVLKDNLNGLKPNVLGIESRLEQIIANILDNSVSFSPNKGEIKVSCNVNKSKVHLSVEDEGPGFNETDINQRDPEPSWTL